MLEFPVFCIIFAIKSEALFGLKLAQCVHAVVFQHAPSVGLMTNLKIRFESVKCKLHFTLYTLAEQGMG